MYEEDKLLAEQCERLAGETNNALDWVGQNSEAVGSEREACEKELRKAGRFLRNCAVAAKRKMCAGVFGPSQAGKSYLVSTLAGDAQGKLLTVLDGRTCDFLSEINPAGGKESTGLVTRFTLTPPAPRPEQAANHPVHIRLLSLTDLVKILANTYFSDAEHMEAPNREAMLATLAELEGRAKPAPAGGMDNNAVEDLQEYIHKYFRSKPRVQQLLDRHFWDRVIPLAPRLDDADRARLFSIIWDGIEPFTRLLSELSAALRALNFAPEAFCSTAALLPRENGIIDVATLGSLAPDTGDMLDVIAQDGSRASLPRVYVTALTAELVIPMQSKPADFFEHTDLLDFPGYRSRKMFIDLAREAEEPAKLKECFLRGKVAYLFERYCAERELTSLLLCIGSGVQEVQGLGGAVNEWISGTHGSTPERRDNKDTALFFVLTKGDLEFEDKAGAKDVSERWDTRMFASMEIFTSHEWLKKWNTAGAFTNFFLMRNPTVKLHLFDHDDTGRETGLKEETAPYVSRFEDAFMCSPVVTEHFFAKDESWKAFMTPNDGGLSLIRSRLAPICKPELKRKQISGIVDEQLALIHNRLKNYWKSDDKEEVRRQKAALGQNIARTLLGLARQRLFGEFIRTLAVRDQDIYELYFQARHQIQEELSAAPAGAAAAAAPKESVDDMMAELFGAEALVAPDAQPSDEDEEDTRPRDEIQAFCEHIEQFWLAGLREHAGDPVTQQHFGFNADLAQDLIEELRIGFVRLGLRAHMEDALRKAGRYANVEQSRRVWQQACLAAECINSYTTWLGLDPADKSDQERTVTVGARQRVVFTPAAEVAGLPVLAEDPTDCNEFAAMDWASALIHLIMENVNFDGAQTFDPVANSRLKGILDALAPSAG